MPTESPSPDHDLSLHVRCTATGIWWVQLEGSKTALSRHITETEAERAACVRAAQLGNCQVVVHDRYGRTHGPGLRPLSANHGDRVTM